MATVEEHLAAIVEDRSSADGLRAERLKLMTEIAAIEKHAAATPRVIFGIKRRMERIALIQEKLAENGQ